MSDYVQYGCGHCAPAGWRNFDASPTLRFERLPLVGRLVRKNATRFPENVEYGDITKGLPIPPESCNAVYCSHVLEHLSLQDLRLALRNTYRILRPTGRFRLVLPDLDRLARRYLANPSEDRALAFMRESGLGCERRDRSLKGLVISWTGNAHHLWMWDFESLRSELGSAGFVGIRRASLGDSPDHRFREVEEASRWEDCLGVESERPL